MAFQGPRILIVRPSDTCSLFMPCFLLLLSPPPVVLAPMSSTVGSPPSPSVSDGSSGQCGSQAHLRELEGRGARRPDGVGGGGC
eukprot:1181515-Pyramimonas_sp.AAC.1